MQQNESLFFYDGVKTWESVNIHAEYEPKFLSDLIKIYENDPFLDQVNKTCDGDQECLFDSLATYDENVGLASKQSSETFVEQEGQLGMLLTFHYIRAFQPTARIAIFAAREVKYFHTFAEL